jgi:hypothetical protein
MIVVLTAWFPQDRIAFLVLLALALSGGICAFVGSVLRNFASYSAALAGYTAVIIAADNLGATGGASADVFLLAVWRASEMRLGARYFSSPCPIRRGAYDFFSADSPDVIAARRRRQAWFILRERFCGK